MSEQNREPHLIQYPEYPPWLEEAIIDYEYDRGLNPHNDGIATSVILTSFVTAPGVFRHELVDDPDFAYTDAGQTAACIVDDGYGDSNIYPIESAAEQDCLPIESIHFLPVHATLAMAGAESPAAAAQLKTIWQNSHAHPATPTAGSLKTVATKRNFARSQIGLEPLPHPVRRRALTPAQTVGADGISF